MIRIILLIFLAALIFNGSGETAAYEVNIERPGMNDSTAEKIIVDSDYSIEDATRGIEIPSGIRKKLVIVKVQYFSFDNKLHEGQVVISGDLRSDIEKIFTKIKEEKFPVAKVIPVSHYGWDDEKSMEDNNTSAFNYRFIAGTKKLSNHSFGRAIDINPLLNPYIRKDLHQPEGSVYDTTQPGTITKSTFLVKEFKKLGWDWGGNWKDRKDYQHFEKP